MTADELHAWEQEKSAFASTDATTAFASIRNWHAETQQCQDWQRAKDKLVQYSDYKRISRSRETWQQRALPVLWLCRVTALWSGMPQRPEGDTQGLSHAAL